MLFSDKNNNFTWIFIFPINMVNYCKSIIVTSIFNFRMQFKLLLHVFNLILFHESSANRTFFIFWNRKVYHTSKLVFLTYSFHKPISIHTNQMEPMKTLINTNQIKSVCKTLLLFIILFIFKSATKLL